MPVKEGAVGLLQSGQSRGVIDGMVGYGKGGHPAEQGLYHLDRVGCRRLVRIRSGSAGRLGQRALHGHDSVLGSRSLSLFCDIFFLLGTAKTLADRSVGQGPPEDEGQHNGHEQPKPHAGRHHHRLVFVFFFFGYAGRIIKMTLL